MRGLVPLLLAVCSARGVAGKDLSGRPAASSSFSSPHLRRQSSAAADIATKAVPATATNDAFVQTYARAHSHLQTLPCMNDCGNQIDVSPDERGRPPSRRGVCVQGRCVCLPGYAGPDCSQGRPAFVPMPQHVKGQPTKDPSTGLVSPPDTAADNEEAAGNADNGELSPDEQALADSDAADPETSDPSCDAATCDGICSFGGACTTKFTCTCFDKWREGPAEIAGLPPSKDKDIDDHKHEDGAQAQKVVRQREPLRDDQRSALALVFRALGVFGGNLPDGDPCTLTSTVSSTTTTLKKNGWVTPQGFAVIRCNASGFVTELDLSRMGLTGRIPGDAIARLPALEFLALSNNKLSGAIPASLGMLGNLDSLLLYRNRLTGALPVELFTRCPLRNLVLYGNLLTGPIPPLIKAVGRTLVHLDLSYNLFSGTIPATVVRLGRVETLFLNHNMFSGPIPTTFKRMTRLKQLRLEENDFTNEFATRDVVTGSSAPVFADSTNDRLGEEWYKEWRDGLKELPGSTRGGKKKEGTSFERWQKKMRAEEDEYDDARNRAEKESQATTKERIGKEKIEEMQGSRLQDDDPLKPLPKIVEKQPSGVDVIDGT